MGNYSYIRDRYRKRKDYDISEIEKKYTDQELSKLILVNYVQNYPTLKYIPERICGNCNKNQVEERMQLSGFLLCEECYKKEKEENFKEMIDIFSSREVFYEGNIILENKLILGGIESSYLKDKLKSFGVTHILMVGYFMTPIYPNDFTYGNFEINDDTYENILQYLVEGVRFIEKSIVCYCHCQLGKSRSASFAIAYVMYKNKMHFSKAFNFVKKKRRLIMPNESFQCQLEDFDIILSNFDYDLDKCDEFIKKHLKERDELRITEKEYITQKIEEQVAKRKRNYSDSDSDSDEDKMEMKVEENNDKKEELTEDKDKKDEIIKENNDKKEEIIEDKGKNEETIEENIDKKEEKAEKNNKNDVLNNEKNENEEKKEQNELSEDREKTEN